MTRAEMVEALSLAIASSVARAMDPIAKRFAPVYEYHAEAVGAPVGDRLAWFMSADMAFDAATDGLGELHSADAQARIAAATEGACAWMSAEGQPFPEA